MESCPHRGDKMKTLVESQAGSSGMDESRALIVEKQQ